MNKTCTSCKKLKSVLDFNKNKRRKDGLQTVCRSCNAKRSKQYYLEHTEKHKEEIRQRRNRKRREVRWLINTIKARYGCRKCGENDAVCLDFHHLDDSTKDFTVAQAVTFEWKLEKLFAEINKCVCLCANCHRKVHAGKLKVDKSLLCNISPSDAELAAVPDF